MKLADLLTELAHRMQGIDVYTIRDDDLTLTWPHDTEFTAGVIITDERPDHADAVIGVQHAPTQQIIEYLIEAELPPGHKPVFSVHVGTRLADLVRNTPGWERRTRPGAERFVEDILRVAPDYIATHATVEALRNRWSRMANANDALGLFALTFQHEGLSNAKQVLEDYLTRPDLLPGQIRGTRERLARAEQLLAATE